MSTERTYRIRNWSEYNRALVERGSLTIWFEDAPAKWLEKNRTGKKGRPKTYSDAAIEYALVIRAVFHLPLRALSGFLASMFRMMNLDIPVPSYSQICRRAAKLVGAVKRLTKKRPTDIVFDSTGVKVYGEGEWKVRQHGKTKRRMWRKVHLGVCPHSHEIVVSELTASGVADAIVGKQMVQKLSKRTQRVYGDGAYDRASFYAQLHAQGIEGIIPPRRGSRLRDINEEPWMKGRNDALRAIVGLGNNDAARTMWKIMAKYHKRSLGETAMSRFKKIFGGDFRSRELRRQKAELYAKSIAMNRMTRLGMPRGEWAAA